MDKRKEEGHLDYWIYNSNTDELTLGSYTKGLDRLVIKDAEAKGKQQVYEEALPVSEAYAKKVWNAWDNIINKW